MDKKKKTICKSTSCWCSQNNALLLTRKVNKKAFFCGERVLFSYIPITTAYKQIPLETGTNPERFTSPPGFVQRRHRPDKRNLSETLFLRTRCSRLGLVRLSPTFAVSRQHITVRLGEYFRSEERRVGEEGLRQWRTGRSVCCREKRH